MRDDEVVEKKENFTEEDKDFVAYENLLWQKLKIIELSIEEAKIKHNDHTLKKEK